jgi:hypothetical protein
MPGQLSVSTYSGTDISVLIGKEVTGDPFYSKINMRARALKRLIVSADWPRADNY